ncbi:hypothetical protein ACYOEI_01055 [Singulisphaera rosea]
MPYISVHVDASDVLDDLDEEEIKNYLRKRAKRSGKDCGFGPNYTIPQREARYTLEEAADIFRAQGRMDLAFKLEEIRTDFVLN